MVQCVYVDFEGAHSRMFSIKCHFHRNRLYKGTGLTEKFLF